MRIWRRVRDVPADLGPTVVTIGNFDGVHLGHQTVLRRAREEAATAGVDQVVVVTFDPHPIAVLRPEHAPPTLTTIETRSELLADAGADCALVVPFDREIAAWSPEQFVDRIVVGPLRAAVVVVGANFRFGAKAAGDLGTLRDLGHDRGFTVVGVELDGGPQVWSSTYVRNCLAAGDVDGAADALGRPFTVRGTVIAGDRRGRDLGFPTANVPTAGMKAAPADGVYAGWLRRLDTGERFPAAISVGTNPTFDGDRQRRVEAFAIDAGDLDLYDVEAEVAFVAWIRGMARFDGLESLVAQMNSDVARCREVLGC